MANLTSLLVPSIKCSQKPLSKCIGSSIYNPFRGLITLGLSSLNQQQHDQNQHNNIIIKNNINTSSKSHFSTATASNTTTTSKALSIHSFITSNSLRNGSCLTLQSPSLLKASILENGLSTSLTGAGTTVTTTSTITSSISPMTGSSIRTRTKKVTKPKRKYKLKTKSVIKKRFILMGSGRFKRRQAGKSHLNVSKSRKRKNRLRKLVLTTKTQTKLLKKMYFK